MTYLAARGRQGVSEDNDKGKDPHPRCCRAAGKIAGRTEGGAVDAAQRLHVRLPHFRKHLRAVLLQELDEVLELEQHVLLQNLQSRRRAISAQTRGDNRACNTRGASLWHAPGCSSSACASRRSAAAGTHEPVREACEQRMRRPARDIAASHANTQGGAVPWQRLSRAAAPHRPPHPAAPPRSLPASGAATPVSYQGRCLPLRAGRRM
jgi:hypothetical protein